MSLVLIFIWLFVMEKVDEFCYLGDVLDADGGCDSTVMARVGSACKKCDPYLSALSVRYFNKGAI